MILCLIFVCFFFLTKLFHRFWYYLNMIQVLVNEVDEKHQARERERATREDEERMADQLRHAETLDAIKRGQVS